MCLSVSNVLTEKGYLHTTAPKLFNFTFANLQSNKFTRLETWWKFSVGKSIPPKKLQVIRKIFKFLPITLWRETQNHE